MFRTSSQSDVLPGAVTEAASGAERQPRVPVRESGCIALHDCKQAANSSPHLGSMKFYEVDIPRIPVAQDVDSVDSIVVLKVKLA